MYGVRKSTELTKAARLLYPKHGILFTGLYRIRLFRVQLARFRNSNTAGSGAEFGDNLFSDQRTARPMKLSRVKTGRFTCVGWQETLCDPVWQVTSRSSVMGVTLRVARSFNV